MPRILLIFGASHTMNTDSWLCRENLRMVVWVDKQRPWGIFKVATKKKRGQGWTQRGGRRSRAAVGSKGTAEQRQARTRVSPGIPGRVGLAKTDALGAVTEAAASLCVLSSDPGKGGTLVTVIFSCRCPAPVALHLLSAAFPGTGKELSTSALPLLCWVVLNQKPAPQCVCKRCSNTHFLTPKWALQLLCCLCPALKLCAELHCVCKEEHASLAKKIIKILLKTYTRKNVCLKTASLHVTIGSTFCFQFKNEQTTQLGFTRNAC